MASRSPASGQTAWRGRQRLLGLTLLVALGLALVLLLRWQELFGAYLYEDSFIAYRYADHWARGLGPTWNPGMDPVEGFSSFTWVAIGALVQATSAVPPERSLPAISAISWVFLVAALAPLGALRMWGNTQPRLGLATSMLAGLAIGAFAPLAVQIFAGLETVFSVAVLTAVVFVAAAERSEPVALAIGSFVAIATRPDALAALGPLWLVVLTRAEPAHRARLLKAAAGLVAACVAYTAGRWAYYGDWVPNTFHIKNAAWGAGTSYVARYLLSIWPLLAAWVVGAAATRGRLLRDRRFQITAIPAVIFLLAFLKVDPIQGKAFRFLLPTVPLLVFAAVRAMAVSLDDARPPRLRKPTAMLILLTILGAVGLADWRYAQRDHERLRAFFLGVGDFHLHLALEVGDMSDLDPVPTLAAADVGAVPYYTKMPTLDLVGLCDATIAREGLTTEYIARWRPDILVLQDLPVKSTPEPEERDASGGASTVWRMNGRLWQLDSRRHGQVKRSMETTHTGLASTYQVVMSPGFATEYEHVVSWRWFRIDTYEVFVRSDHPHRDEIVRRLGSARPRRPVRRRRADR